MPPWLTRKGEEDPKHGVITAFASKGITLPGKGQGKGQPTTGHGKNPVTLDSVTPTLIQTPSHDARGVPSRSLSLPRPRQQNQPRLAPQSSSDTDALSVRLDEIVERLQVLEQRSEEILNLLQVQLAGMD